jgi:uncharacterized membrane protein YdcZ (DUF606 family)
MLKIIINLIFFILLGIFIVLNTNYKTEINFYGKIYNDISVVSIMFISFLSGIIYLIILYLLYGIKTSNQKLKDIDKNKIKNTNSENFDNIDVDLKNKKIIKKDKK